MTTLLVIAMMNTYRLQKYVKKMQDPLPQLGENLRKNFTRFFLSNLVPLKHEIYIRYTMYNIHTYLYFVKIQQHENKNAS